MALDPTWSLSPMAWLLLLPFPGCSLDSFIYYPKEHGVASGCQGLSLILLLMVWWKEWLPGLPGIGDDRVARCLVGPLPLPEASG